MLQWLTKAKNEDAQGGQGFECYKKACCSDELPLVTTRRGGCPYAAVQLLQCYELPLVSLLLWCLGDCTDDDYSNSRRGWLLLGPSPFDQRCHGDQSNMEDEEILFFYLDDLDAFDPVPQVNYIVLLSKIHWYHTNPYVWMSLYAATFEIFCKSEKIW